MAALQTQRDVSCRDNAFCERWLSFGNGEYQACVSHTLGQRTCFRNHSGIALAYIWPYECIDDKVVISSTRSTTPTPFGWWSCSIVDRGIAGRSGKILQTIVHMHAADDVLLRGWTLSWMNACIIINDEGQKPLILNRGPHSFVDFYFVQQSHSSNLIWYSFCGRQNCQVLNSVSMPSCVKWLNLR